MDYFAFLGGTCNGSKWRELLIPMLNFNAFNPVVETWDEKAQEQEKYWRRNADYVLYVITPLMTGVYSIAEVVDDSNKRPLRTLFCVLENDGGKVFDKHQLKSLEMVKTMVRENGAVILDNLEDVADFLNAS